MNTFVLSGIILLVFGILNLIVGQFYKKQSQSEKDIKKREDFTHYGITTCILGAVFVIVGVIYTEKTNRMYSS